MAAGLHQLDGYFTRLARSFAKHHGVEVIVRGAEVPRAELARRRIYLPATADYATGEGRDALEGLLDHETAHIEQEVLAEAEGRPTYTQTWKQCRNGRERMWLNVFEDVRIEELWAARWPGVRSNLEAKNRHGLRVAGERYRSGGTDAHWALGCGVIAYARDFGDLCNWLPPEVKAILARLAPEIEASRHQVGPQDGLALARRALAKIEEIANGPEPDSPGDVQVDDHAPAEGMGGGSTGEGKAKTGNGDEGEDCDNSEAAGDEPAAQGDPDPTEEGEGEAEPEGEGDDESEGEGGDLGEVQAPAEPGVDAATKRMAEDLTDTAPRCEDPLAEVAKSLKVAADREAGGDPRRVMAHPLAAANDRVLVPREDVTAYRKAAAVALPAVNALATRLMIWLRAKADRVVPDQLSGAIDGSALASLVTGGDRRIFQHVEEAPDVRTAVIVLVDESGSMGDDDKYLRAREAAVGLGWTLQRCGIAFEILGWTDVEVRGVSCRDLGLYTRVEAQQIYAYKAFHEHFPRVCNRLGTMEPRENNDDSSAILTVARRLLTRPEPRKILLVLSDGAPAHEGHSPAVQLHHVIAQVRKAGIEVGGIGICSDHVREFYAPHVVVVHRPADLAVRTMELFKALCQKSGARRAS